MKYILLWLQGWFEMIIEVITWPIFVPYYKAVTMNKVRKELAAQREAHKRMGLVQNEKLSKKGKDE